VLGRRRWESAGRPHLFRLPYYFCGAADICRYRVGETEQRRRASLSAADLSVAALIAPGQHYHTCYQRAPPLLEYLNILSSSPLGDAAPRPPMHCCDNVAATALFIFINAALSVMSRNVY
jgi:hypothetical protein